MKASPPSAPGRTYNLPYLVGVYLAVNAVSDACVIVDGPNCVMPKADFIAGNHDLYSTLLSADGRHRVICTMTNPLPQEPEPERKLLALLAGAREGGFGAALLTGLPFMKLAGIDYDGIAAAAGAGVPAAGVPYKAFDSDWLDGYAEALDALVGALPPGKARRKKRSVALVGYLADRGERDHAANLAELKALLCLCGLELACVLPSGSDFASLSRALEAGVVAALPYGRKAAARLAARTGAKLVETGLPMGFSGTAAWLQALRRACGLRGPLPPAVLARSRAAAAAVSPLLDALAHRRVLFAGDPYLFQAFASFAGDLRMRVTAAFLDSFPRPLKAARPEVLHFAPESAEAPRALAGLRRYSRPELAVGNTFAATEGYAAGLPFVELGFPSYSHHCLADEPFLGFAGAAALAGRLLNGLKAGPYDLDRGESVAAPEEAGIGLSPSKKGKI
jgi:nitrogenase molybdenum-iron protein alpha/beta subunit